MTVAQLHMPHPFAGAFQQARGIDQRRAVEKADIHMAAESIDVSECGVSDACRGMTVMQQPADVRSAREHAIEPWPGHAPQFIMARREPGLDTRVVPGSD